MKTNPACIPCFRRQALYAVQLATADSALQAEILAETETYLAELDMDKSPPVNSIGLYDIISSFSGNPDPFLFLKQQSNTLAMGLRPRVEELIRQGDDPLYRAILFAIAGNIIDYGSQQKFDFDSTLNQCLNNSPIINDYDTLIKDLVHARRILYLADNCGEIVFDGLLADQLPGVITMVVKSGPIINDATEVDTTECGINQRYRVITNGTTCPGTPLELCGKDLQALFTEADVVISKGQGNFETLSEEERPIYHLLTVKCPVVAEHIVEVSNRSDLIPTGAAVLLKLGDTRKR
ncbi:MAG: DUF89 family protein [Proteobacteria bacterium]|nr:DUF89 family protein [Desulfobulbaceae bacterium]MBU4153768.1 DUF89 family protein [Pseudomonadota bacterium]MDP2104873.1 ARMT1-like domain-containing protein [Desulfobulbaceae bacterium]